jgi:hypothetical protein
LEKEKKILFLFFLGIVNTKMINTACVVMTKFVREQLMFSSSKTRWSTRVRDGKLNCRKMKKTIGSFAN